MNITEKEYLDKSLTRLNTRLLITMQNYINDVIVNLTRVANEFSVSNWFAKKLIENDSFFLLKYAVAGREGITLDSLVYAYKNPGTLESVINVCKALFGLDSGVLLDVSTPAVWIININDAGINFNAGIVAQMNTAGDLVGKALVENSNNKWIIAQIFKNLDQTNIINFLRLFIPAGHSITVNFVRGD